MENKPNKHGMRLSSRSDYTDEEKSLYAGNAFEDHDAFSKRPELKEIQEAFQVCDEFDTNFNAIVKDDVILQIKQIDSNKDMMTIDLDEEEVERIVRNEKRPV